RGGALGVGSGFVSVGRLPPAGSVEAPSVGRVSGASVGVVASMRRVSSSTSVDPFADVQLAIMVDHRRGQARGSGRRVEVAAGQLTGVAGGIEVRRLLGAEGPGIGGRR